MGALTALECAHPLNLFNPRLILISPQPQHFPPRGANRQPDGDVYGTDHKTRFPPGSQRHVSAAKQDGSRSGAVMRQAGEETAEEAEYQCGQRRRRAQRYRHSEKWCVHCADVSRHAGKEIMRVEVCEAETEQPGNPADAAECG